MGTGYTVRNEWGHAIGEAALGINHYSAEALRSLIGNAHMLEDAHLNTVHHGPPRPIPQENQDIRHFSIVVAGYAPGGINARRPNGPPTADYLLLWRYDTPNDIERRDEFGRKPQLFNDK